MRILAGIGLLLGAAMAVAAVPPLVALRGFEPGLWQVRSVGSPETSSQCLADPELMLTGGQPASGCSFSVIANSGDGATLTYRCSSGRSGRTQIRRDADGLFTVDGQGLADGHPFAARTEWRRTGGC